MKKTIIPEKLKELRKANGYTQDYVASYLGIVRQTYSHYETGSRNIPIEMLIRLADYYDTTIDYLVGRTDNKEPIK